MSLDALKKAWAKRELTLYLGAGVSMPSGLPSWDRLVLTMYLAALGELDRADNPLQGWRVFPNYLEAIAGWLLGRRVDPAEITAQKIRSMVPDDAAFVDLLRERLYAPLESGPKQNKTLDAVKKLCAEGGHARGVRAVVTYNYDDLLERAPSRCAPVWELATATEPAPDKVPAYHVHGYLGSDGEGSSYGELVLTEEQFHAAASDPYSWSNLVQMRQLGSSVGLMVGMSLDDRNLRRVLEAMRKLSGLPPQYAILRYEPQSVDDAVLEEIESRAREYGHQRKVGDVGRQQVEAILGKLDEFDREMTERVLTRLGVEAIWVDEFDEIPDRLAAIAAG